MPKNKSSPGEKADFFAFPSRFTILGQVRKNTIPIYLPTKRPRIGTIMKNHIQSSSGLSKAALFVCSESDTSLKNYSHFICQIQQFSSQKYALLLYFDIFLSQPNIVLHKKREWKSVFLFRFHLFFLLLFYSAFMLCVSFSTQQLPLQKLQ